MGRKSVILFLIVFAVSACKKKYYPNDEVVITDNVISFSGAMGGKDVALSVGTNNYYCFTGIEHRADSVLEFNSLLAPYDCSTCANSFLMTLSDVSFSNAGNVKNADSTFKIGKRVLNAGLIGIPNMNLTASSNKAIKTSTWYLQNKVIANSSTISQEVLKQGYSTFKLKVETESNCENTVESQIWVDPNGIVFFTELVPTPKTGNTVQFTSHPNGGQGNYEYLWMFGDGESSTEANPTHVFAYKGNYPVVLKITDANNHTVTASYIVVVGADSSSCALGIELKQLGIRSVKFGAVSLQWRDDLNNLYSTAAVEQPSISYFEISESKQFVNNEREENGRLLTIRFSAVMSNGSNTIQATVEKATMAVSYK